VPDPRRIVVVAVDVGEARRSESQKGLDEALRAGHGLRKVSMAMGRRLWQASLRTPGGTWPASSAPREGPRHSKPLGAPPAACESATTKSERPQGSLLGSENVMSGTEGGW